MIDYKKYELLLNNTVKEMNKDDKEAIKELLKYVDENKPTSLYHYRNCSERTIEAFIENKIYFNTANNFNDPYDCLIYCNIDNILNRIQNMFDYKKIENSINEIIDDTYLNTRPITILPEKAQEIVNILNGQNIKDIYETIPKGTLNNIINFLKKLSPNVLENYKNYYKNIQPLACLSETYNDILMWSHYADNHKGFVIEYDTDTLKTKCMNCSQNKTFQTCPNWKQIMLLPILYTKKRYDATNYIFENTIIQTFKNAGIHDIFQLSDDFAQYKINIHKHTDWNYEREWRLQLYKSNHENFITVKPKAIYLGCRISKFYEDILVRYASEQKIQIYKMDENNSSIKYELIEKKYKKSQLLK